MNRPLLMGLVAIIAGILLSFWQMPLWMVLVIAAMIGALPLVWEAIPRGFVVFSLVCYGVGWVSAGLAFMPETDLAALQGDQRVTAVVEALSGNDTDKTTLRLKTQTISDQHRSIRLQATLAHYDSPMTKLPEPGDLITLDGELSLPEGSRNPGGFDYGLYLKGQGIQGLFYGKNGSSPIINGQDNALGYSVERFREQVLGVITQAFPEEQAEVMKGLLLGDKSMAADLKTQFSNAGISHLLAVSGLHVGFLYTLVLGVAALLGLKERGRLFLLLPCLAFYSALTGFSPSVLRAAIMLLVLVGGQVIKTHYDGLSGLCLAAILILVVSPAQLFAAGFQMSFGAVCGILLFAKPLCYSIMKGTGLQGNIVNTLVLTLCATIGTLPATLYHFHTLNLVALVSNLLLVPLAGLLFTIGLPMVVLMLVLPGLTPVFASVPGFLAHWILKLTAFFSGTMDLRFNGGPMGILDIVLLAMAAFTVAGYFNFRHRRERLWVCTVLPVLFLSVIALSLLPGPLRVTFLDVGQGDSALVQTPEGGAYLIDGGGYPVYGDKADHTRQAISEKVLLPGLYAYGITRLDGVFITHHHEDHAQGIEELLGVLPVEHIYVSTKYNDAALLNQDKIPISQLSRGAILRTRDGVGVQVLWPDGKVEALEEGEQNDASLVLRLTYGARSILLMGDAGLGVEAQLGTVDSDVIKIGHHGSATASDTGFLEQVSPAAAVVSVGRYNTFGHPDGTVLANIEAAGARCYRTDEQGAVVVETNGQNLEIKTMLEKE
ncbi:DNA internalization-related competence protein ComEC/Rec2 [Eubacterium sp.]|uniref:DNA internalization-related competence protein ComEC/Rec2 n=1 Tax=Eubacterium sp. TaxID=142586 RepID=UPI002FC6632C